MSSLGFFAFAMVVNPDIQAKAQGMIDEVCPGRLPTFDDMSDLPYIDALVKETLRWRPVLPLSAYIISAFQLSANLVLSRYPTSDI